jgi:hypothetical protein
MRNLRENRIRRRRTGQEGEDLGCNRRTTGEEDGGLEGCMVSMTEDKFLGD